jgi:hypothetical protein
VRLVWVAMACQLAIPMHGSHRTNTGFRNVAVAPRLSIAVPSCTFREFRACNIPIATPEASEQFQR